MKVTVSAPAKINLMLDILGKREDGYHELWMIMQSIDIADEITVATAKGSSIKITCSVSELPTDEHNIAHKAALAFFAGANLPVHGIEIHIEKKIPFAAGLAGGSADGAAVLLALNYLFGAGLSMEELCSIGLSVGADVPFCLMGGTRIAQETGGKLTQLPPMPDCTIVLGKPEQGVSTALAYIQYDHYPHECRHPDQNGMVKCIEEGDLDGMGRLVNNVFEQFIDVPDRVSIKTVMRRNQALGVCMSGSGPTVFGLFRDTTDAEKCAQELGGLLPDVFVCRPLSHGCQLVQKQ